MRPALLVAAIAGVLLAAGLAWWARGGDERAGSVDGGGGVARATRADAVALREPAGSARAAAPTPTIASAVPSAASAAPSSATPTAITKRRKPAAWGELGVEVRVLRAEDGAPLAGVPVWIGESDIPPEGAPITGADGIARLDRVTSGDVRVWAGAPGRAKVSGTTRLQPGSPTGRVDLRLEQQRAVRVRLVDAHGADASPVALGLDASAAQSVTLAIGDACAPVGARFDAPSANAARVTPDSWRGDRFGWKLAIRGDGTGCVHVLVGDAVVASEPLVPGTTELAIPIERAAFASALAPFRVRVVSDPDRAGIAGAEVVLARPHGAAVTLATGADGFVRVESGLVVDGELRVSAAGFARENVRLRRPFEGDVLVTLRTGHVVEGIVLDAEGRPESDVALAAYAGTDMGRVASPVARAKSGPDGRFAFEAIAGDEIVLCLDERGIERGYLPQRDNLTAPSQVVAIGGGARGVVVKLPRVALCGDEPTGR